MRIVIDTNIYLSGLIFPKSFPGQVLKMARTQKIEVYCSNFILDEIKKNLIIKFHYSEDMAEKFISGHFSRHLLCLGLPQHFLFILAG